MKKTTLKKSILILACALIVCAFAAIGLCACNTSISPGGNNGNGGIGSIVDKEISKQEVYALSAASGASYLIASGNASAISAAEGELARPSYILDADVQGIKDCLELFENLIGNDMSQTVAQNTDIQEFADFAYVMTVSFNGVPQMKMYYNETETRTETEIDDGVEETETTTRLVGIMAVGDARFDVLGEIEIETEGNETEKSIEFTTKSKSNPSNYVVVSQSIEDNEYEFEYKIYENGIKVQDLEIELEEENGKTELEFSLKETSAGTTTKTKYEIVKANSANTFEIKTTVNSAKVIITASPVEEGYKLTYANGFEEIV